MKLELSSRERAIGIGIGAALIVLAGWACITHFQVRRALVKDADNVRAELRAVTAQRDFNATELAPFESLAEQQFPRESPEMRLPLLLRRIKAITTGAAQMEGRRHLEPEAIGRIRAKLGEIPTLDIEVGGVWNDPEALALAQELRMIFENGEFKIRKLAQYFPPPNIPPGVSVYSKHQLDQLLSPAIAQLFTELGQEPIQWLEDETTAPAKSMARDPELKIVVGPK